MLDANLILKDAEELLAEHYTELQQQKPGKVGVYETPKRAPITTQAQPVPMVKANPISDFVTNVFVLFVLAALTEKLANR